MFNKEKAPKEQKKQSVISELFDYLEIFIFAACAVMLLFTFSVRLCRVDGDSMLSTLEDGQMLMVSDVFYTPDTGDIIVFHQSDNPNERLNKPLVKRVIATGGQYYKLEYVPTLGSNGNTYYKMNTYVSEDESFESSELLDESFIDFEAAYKRARIYSGIGTYASKCKLDKTTGIYTMTGQVPEGELFVMGDNRYYSTDSRLDVGYVDTECVLGKLVIRLTPFGTVK